MKAKTYLEVFEFFFIALGFMFFSNALEDVGLFPDAIISISRYFLALISLVFVLLRYKSLHYKFKRNIALVLVIFLVTMSFVWSGIGSETLFVVRSQFLPMTVFGLYLAASYNIRDLVIKLSLIAAFLVLLNYLLVIGAPSIGVDQGGFQGAWTGIHRHKNGASAYSVLGALLFTIMARHPSQVKWFGILRQRYFMVLSLLAFTFVLKTTSGTGTALSLFLITSLALYPRFKWKGRKTILLIDIAAMILLVVGVAVFGYWDEILTGLGKDPTLTGRTVFWGISLEALLKENPLLGFGRGAFWEQSSSYIQAIEYYFRGAYDVPHAHNGFIEIALDVGIIGFSFFAINIFTTLRRSLRQAYQAIDPINLFPLGYTIAFLVNNMTESLTSNLYTMFWPLYIAVSLNAGLPHDWKITRHKKTVAHATSSDLFQNQPFSQPGQI